MNEMPALLVILRGASATQRIWVEEGPAPRSFRLAGLALRMTVDSFIRVVFLPSPGWRKVRLGEGPGVRGLQRRRQDIDGALV